MTEPNMEEEEEGHRSRQGGAGLTRVMGCLSPLLSRYSTPLTPRLLYLSLVKVILSMYTAIRRTVNPALFTALQTTLQPLTDTWGQLDSPPHYVSKLNQTIPSPTIHLG